MKALLILLLSMVSLAGAVDEAIEVDIRKLTEVDWKEGQELPKEIRELDGKEVVISGYMQEQFQDDRKTFLIVSDSCQCSGTPLPNHFVEITLENETDYRTGQLTFKGKLSVGEKEEDGFVTSLYRLEGSFF